MDCNGKSIVISTKEFVIDMKIDPLTKEHTLCLWEVEWTIGLLACLIYSLSATLNNFTNVMVESVYIVGNT
jgi:hypothetical protein